MLNGNEWQEGKSTILKTITGALPPISGTVTKTDGIVLGDLLQQHERADRDEKAIEFFYDTKPTAIMRRQYIH